MGTPLKASDMVFMEKVANLYRMFTHSSMMSVDAGRSVEEIVSDAKSLVLAWLAKGESAIGRTLFTTYPSDFLSMISEKLQGGVFYGKGDC